MGIYSKEDMIGVLETVRIGIERGTYILRPSLSEHDPEYAQKLKAAMLCAFDRMIQTTEWLFDNHSGGNGNA